MAQGQSRRRGKPRAATDAGIPESNPYREMLSEVIIEPAESSSKPAVKKRRIGGRLVVQSVPKRAENSEESEDDASLKAPSVSSVPAVNAQTIYNESDDSEDSESDWEDVDLNASKDVDFDFQKSLESERPRELNIVLDDKDKFKSKSSAPRRKPLNREERKLRLEIHKMNLLCLLAHVHLRNHWCNNDEVQSALRQFLSKKTLSYLDDDETQSQFQRNRSFVDGVKQAYDTFKQVFTIDARGMARCFWADDPDRIGDLKIPEDIDLPVEKPDFCQVAHKLAASRDIGAQLFCALLRSAGMEVRLVCSLQALPLTSTTKGTTPTKSKPVMTVAYQETWSGMPSTNAAGGAEHGAPSLVKLSPGKAPSKLLKAKKKKIRESHFPIYWVEAFNAAYQKWVPIDPLVTDTIAKSTKFEPPASDSQNNLVYVVAFEEDGSAKDVTRRYAQAYNAKTRKARVESTKGGERWWKRVMRLYKRSYSLNRDQVEDAELSKKEAQEPMPKNILDFKDHPYYALERHTKRNEVIHPKREAGKVSIGKGGIDADKSLEPIYRRRDVHVVKSADSWYRIGREIKVGEQPLKIVQPRKAKAALIEADDSGAEENPGTAMYAGFQTCAYEPPPIVKGRVPRNEYGNLDVYVPGMIPPGGVHIDHRDASKAARLLAIDYADAVTGFEFRGRHGTAVVKGVVVAAEYADAMVETIHGYGYEQAESMQLKRSLNALRMWKRFLSGLRIRERIYSYDIEGDNDDHLQEQLDEEEEDEDEGAGGFLPDRDQDPTTLPQPDYAAKKLQFEVAHQVVNEIEVSAFVEPKLVYGSQLPTAAAPVGLPQRDEAPVHAEEAVDFLFEDEGDEQGGGILPEESAGGFLVEDLSEGKLLNEAPPNDLNRKDNDLHDPDVSKNLNSESNDKVVDTDGLGVNTELSCKADVQQQQHSLFEAKSSLTEKVRLPDEGTSSESANVIELQETNSKAATDSSDQGSLLSHDPEDEDADPEWLE